MLKHGDPFKKKTCDFFGQFVLDKHCLLCEIKNMCKNHQENTKNSESKNED